jgi:acyl carrier protein
MTIYRVSVDIDAMTDRPATPAATFETTINGHSMSALELAAGIEKAIEAAMSPRLEWGTPWDKTTKPGAGQ